MLFAEFVVHVTVQCSASGRFVHQHQHQHQQHILCCQMVCQPHFVGLNTTTNELLCRWHICWIYHTCHCTVFSIMKICFSASALASATPIVLPNGMLTILLAWILQQMNYCVNNTFAEFIIHITVQHSASVWLVYWHWHQHRPHLWCCWTLCWPHFVGLNTTTNEFLYK